MRIGIVCPYNYFRPGGVQTCIREIARELERRGHYVRVVAPHAKIEPETKESNVLLIGGSTEFNTPFATKADLGISVSNERIDQLFAQEKFDVLHIHEPGIPMLGAQLLSRSTSANVGTLHATLPENIMSKSFEKLMIPFAKYIEPRLHAITAVSPVALNSARAYAPHAQVDIVPNGIALDEYLPKKKPKKLHADKKTILYIGRLERRKGVRYLIDAYAELRKEHSDVQLLIVGDGRLRASLEARVKKYSVPDVTFLGFISEAEKKHLLQSADLFCSPALYGESFGIVLLEAMAAGCVVVGGNNPGYASVMTEIGRLSLVNPESTSDFAHRLELMLFDESLRKLWLAWSKQNIAQYDYRQIVNQYEDVYAKAILNKRATKLSLAS
jgi:phosphatidyl-myo-inositol alpha-mannosyltransferase